MRIGGAMCREIIYFCAELLNYWSMTFFGLKLFAKVYGFEVHKNKIVENGIYALMGFPMGILGSVNSEYTRYSTFLTHVIVFYMYVLILFICKNKAKIHLSFIAFYILSLWKI